MTIVLGVDGGATKTHAVVAGTTGEVLGTAVDGPSNWEDVGLANAGSALRGAVMQALGTAEVNPEELAASVFGLAGLDWESDRPRLAELLEPLGLGGEREIVNDSFVALRAGANNPWGVVVIAGTGTVAAGRNREGREFRTLGLGPMFGDFGSASEVAEEAVRAVADAYVGRGPHTLLTDLLREYTACELVTDALESVSRSQRPVDAMASRVLETAEEGDAVARSIVEHAGSALGESAAVIIRRLAMEDEQFEVVLSGGLFRGGSRLLTTTIERAVKRAAQSAALVRLETPPVVGAALRALELASGEPAGGVHLRLSLEVIKTLKYDVT